MKLHLDEPSGCCSSIKTCLRDIKVLIIWHDHLIFIQCTLGIYISVLYIMELATSQLPAGPHFFLPTHIANFKFCRHGTQERDIFREIALTAWIPLVGGNFFRYPLILFTGDNFFAKFTLVYLSMQARTYAVWWSATQGGALTPPLCHRVGSS